MLPLRGIQSCLHDDSSIAYAPSDSLLPSGSFSAGAQNYDKVVLLPSSLVFNGVAPRFRRTRAPRCEFLRSMKIINCLSTSAAVLPPTQKTMLLLCNLPYLAEKDENGSFAPPLSPS